MKQNKINNETMTVNGTVENEVNNTKKTISLFPHQDNIMGEVKETEIEDREFYGFGDTNNEFWDLLAYKDEIPLMEFAVYAKAFMLQSIEENACTQFKVHGFESRLLGLIEANVEIYEA